MQQWRFYHHFRTDALSPIRAPQIGFRTPILSNDGHDLAAALQTIREIGNTEILAQVIDRAFPGAELIIECDGKSRFETLLKMPSVLRPLETNELSDGTLRYLCLVAALLSPRPPKLLALNEPETSLHPDLLAPLAELIAQAARFSQLWIATHSKRLAEMISEFSGESIIQLRMGKKGTEVVR
jgi:predicted ATPase